MRYLALGDSYTIGEGVAEDARWPVVLARALARGGVSVDPPEIIARTGWTTEELTAAVDHAGLTGPYDLVTVLIGVNDQYRGGFSEAYRLPLARLLIRAVALADGDARRVIVVSIPDWGVTPFAAGRNRAEIAKAIDDFNVANRKEAARVGAHYVDVTAASRAAPGDVVADGLHPNPAMYARWVDLVLPAAVEALLSR